MTHIIYLIGRPGVGKYTIAKELAKQGYLLCDNHYINNIIFGLLGPDFLKMEKGETIPEFVWEHTRKIRDIILDFLVIYNQHNYVFTNVLYEDKHDREIYEKIKSMSEKRGSTFTPIVLSITREEHRNRITQIDRVERRKSTSLAEIDSKEELIKISHPNLITLDITSLTAAEAAKEIVGKLDVSLN